MITTNTTPCLRCGTSLQDGRCPRCLCELCAVCNEPIDRAQWLCYACSNSWQRMLHAAKYPYLTAHEREVEAIRWASKRSREVDRERATPAPAQPRLVCAPHVAEGHLVVPEMTNTYCGLTCRDWPEDRRPQWCCRVCLRHAFIAHAIDLHPPPQAFVPTPPAAPAKRARRSAPASGRRSR